VPDTETLTQPKTVEGSDGLLLEIDGQIVPNYDATIIPFEEGDVVSGRVVQIDQDEVLVDIGYKSEGVIPLNELSIRKSVDPHDEVEMGEEVDALVLTKEDQDGRLLLSKKRARFEKAWRKIEAAAESGEPVEGTVIEVVKGGLIIDLGVRGFLPASLVDIRRVQNLDEFLGTKIECKVIELNRSRNNVVLSRRAVLEEERKEVRQQILDRLQPGMIVEGAISNIVDFGAFVDLDGIDGLIHISELSWSHVNHPSEILAIGDVVPVKVLDIDRDRQRISLGLKQTQEDPWQRVIDTYRVGDELEGKVTKVVTFGAFVEIMDGVEGLVHISELAHHHVENPREILEPGQDVRVKVLEIDSERRRLSLSVKRVTEQLPHIKSAAAAGAAAQGATEEIGDVPDLGLSEDVFAGPQVSGAEDLRAAVADFGSPAEEAPPLEERPAVSDEAAPAGDEAPAAAPAGDEPPVAAPADDEARAAASEEASAAASDEAASGEPASASADEAASGEPASASADEAAFGEPASASADEAASGEPAPASGGPAPASGEPAATAGEAAPAPDEAGAAGATSATTGDEAAAAGDEPSAAPSEEAPAAASEEAPAATSDEPASDELGSDAPSEQPPE
jgi:small subunit ribosomal protein S1